MIITKKINNYPTLRRIREALVEALKEEDPNHEFPIQTADALLIDFHATGGPVIKYEGVGFRDYIDKPQPASLDK